MKTALQKQHFLLVFVLYLDTIFRYFDNKPKGNTETLTGDICLELLESHLFTSLARFSGSNTVCKYGTFFKSSFLLHFPVLYTCLIGNPA